MFNQLKRVVLTSAVILSVLLTGKAQTITNVHSEQDGNNINIYYDINGAKDNQTFRISVLCETETKKFTLKSMSGDAGDNIKGGKGKKIVWDVFKDIDSLGSASFSVRIDQVNDNRSLNGTLPKTMATTPKTLGFMLSGGISLVNNEISPTVELIGGYTINSNWFIGLGIAYQRFNINTELDSSSISSGIPNLDFTNYTDSFMKVGNKVSEQKITSFPLSIHLRYTMNDVKYKPYIFTNLGLVFLGSASYSYQRINLPAYDYVGLYSSGSSPAYNAYLSNSKTESESVSSNASLKTGFTFGFGAGLQYPLSNKISLTLYLSYSITQYRYEVNNQYYLYQYNYLEPATFNGNTYDVAFQYQNRELKDMVTTEVKNFQSITIKIGLLY